MMIIKTSNCIALAAAAFVLVACERAPETAAAPTVDDSDPTGGRLVVPAGRAPRRHPGDGTPLVDGIPVPLNLAYAPNHMWLDVGDDGCRHVGIDAFLARIIGNVDAISFVVPRGDGRPVAVLTVNGVDLQLAFPTPLRRAVANVYLRTSPAKLTSDPYGTGWLFESVEQCSTAPADDDGHRGRLGDRGKGGGGPRPPAGPDRGGRRRRPGRCPRSSRPRTRAGTGRCRWADHPDRRPPRGRRSGAPRRRRQTGR